jgi:cysteine desulfurase/selenocysteine lyase
MNPHNSDSSLTRLLKQKIIDARATIAKHFNAHENEIIFTSGATESLNIIANNLITDLKKGDEVITTYTEHASNLLP